MFTDKLKELQSTRAKLSQLEQSVEAELHRELASLPAQYGFESAEAFITAVRAASGRRRGRPPGSSAAPAKPKRRSRATITDETRANVKRLVKEGKTGSEIAKEVGISLPSVQNIKKALGLVRTK